MCAADRGPTGESENERDWRRDEPDRQDDGRRNDCDRRADDEAEDQGHAGATYALRVALLRSLLLRRDIWKRIAVERLTEPLHLNAIAFGVALAGSTRAKAAFDVLVRQQHAYGLLDAADEARRRGLRRVTVVELGVGGGAGLLNICDLAGRVARATEIEFDIVGFDTGAGLPPPTDHRDHPELYSAGSFPHDRHALERALPSNARIVYGDLRETIDPFVATLTPDAPLGFATLDVDYYTSSQHALRLFLGDARCYLPTVSVYVDDVHERTHTRFAGELLAIDEFNAEHELRKLDVDRSLVYSRVFKHAEWLQHMHRLHVFDHPERSDADAEREIEVAPNPYLS
jgi:hypothetical protein